MTTLYNKEEYLINIRKSEKYFHKLMSIFNKLFKTRQRSRLTDQGKSGFHTPDFDKYNDFGQIVSIFDYVFIPSFTIANKAAETIHRLFNTVGHSESKQLYKTFRYLNINKTDIKKFDRFDFDIKVTLLCIASMNGNGYSREAALDRLSEIKSHRIIPFIIFRLADWVDPIRKKAEAIFAGFITKENIICFIQNHKLIDWLLQVERIDLSGLYIKIADLITSKQLEVNDIGQLTNGERLFYYLRFAKQEKLNSDLAAQMLNDKYYLIRIILIKNLDRIEDTNVVLTKLLSDKSQKVRQGAVSKICNQNPEHYEELLKELIFDTSLSVRYESRKLLDKINKHDFKELYTSGLKEDKQLIGSILGLSEVSDKSDVSIIRPFLESEKAKVRSAALIGIYNLDKELATEIAYQIIGTINPVSTKKAAEYILSKNGVDYDLLRKIYDSTDIPGKKIILRLLNHYGGWSIAGDFLKAMTENEETLSLLANSFLKQWDLYTRRLATKQKAEDKEYVMNWYNRAKEMGLSVPGNIPFIFGEK